ncbi:MAG: hypothetical protein RR598_10250 [Anaerorhabdus sp.]|uniref:hypothetical protein n=1 Tax=Anaerorhabdus sp. TaxID=1872524 RepID=UPI002FC9A7AC
MEIFGIILTSSVVSALISGLFQCFIKSFDNKKKRESIKYEFLKSKLDSLTSPNNFNNYMLERSFLLPSIPDELNAMYREYIVIYESVKFDLKKKDIKLLDELSEKEKSLFMDEFYEILQKEVSRLRK